MVVMGEVVIRLDRAYDLLSHQVSAPVMAMPSRALSPGLRLLAVLRLCPSAPPLVVAIALKILRPVVHRDDRRYYANPVQESARRDLEPLAPGCRANGKAPEGAQDSCYENKAVGTVNFWLDPGGRLWPPSV
ncbi:MAG: hypothetical protein C5B58_01390 [Acidobacteria bacterium]|nr:MAG: hypothetical protein C5B58_01390 [Acidobacteriota bacterium]